ncbi:MAG TPA: preprotein translocase subunit SecG [Hyphomicrobiaceae bacterium]|jgi:preprotein translocase subunit SecG|nr:preprotein translocase subunit SecG [Hyphomicrobiaceae bacterium]
MSTVLLIIHLMVAAALVGVVLMQRSEGGALGIGGGGGFMAGRSGANFLTRVTAGLAAAFFATSIILSLLATHPNQPASIVEQPAAGKAPEKAPAGKTEAPAAPGGSILDRLPSGPRVPQSK